jgi:hypothetical protein
MQDTERKRSVKAVDPSNQTNNANRVDPLSDTHKQAVNLFNCASNGPQATIFTPTGTQ